MLYSAATHMKARLLLPLLWLLAVLLPAPRLWAQGRPLGPWRLTLQMVSKRADWDDLGPAKPAEKVLKLVPTAVKWDVVSDSIRLFLNCENPLISPTQPRKGQLPVRFSATGATVRLDLKNKLLLIVPFEAAVTLRAFRGQTLLFQHAFRAVTPPLPTVEGSYGGAMPTDLRPGEEWRRLSLRAIPPPEFSSFMPNDAHYRVSRYQVSCLRNNIPLRPPTMMDGPAAVLGHPADFQHCDQIQVDVQLFQRQNFRGEVETLPLSQRIMVGVR